MTDNPLATPQTTSVPTPGLRHSDGGWLAVVCALSLVYMSFFIWRGWIPHDEGLLAQTAERVLDGELPHRDFDDCYTGGLAVLYAAAFQAFGVKLTSIRILFFLAAAATVPLMFSLARRAVSPRAAALCTLLCLTWSVPNYFAGMPSWYTMFLSVTGIWALARFFDSGRVTWIVLAGACGGLALLVKVTGLYFIAAALIALVYHEQRRARETYGPDALRSSVMLVRTVLVAGGLLACVALLLRRMWQPMDVIYFVIPTVAIGEVIVWHEWRVARGPTWPRFQQWSLFWGLFGFGVALPVACFLVPYVVRGGVIDLYLGVFVRPAERFELAAFEMPKLITLVTAILWLVPLACARALGSTRTVSAAVFGASFTMLAGVALLWACRYPLGYDVVWCSARSALPLIVTAACILIVLDGRAAETHPRRMELLFTLASSALLLSLQQFPFALAIYFLYGAPLLILTAVYILAGLCPERQRVGWCLAWFYLAFSVLWMNPAFNLGLTKGYVRDARQIELTRAGLIVPDGHAQLYESLVKLIQQHSSPGNDILAFPDCPEVCFLAERRNPTRRLFDFLTPVNFRADDITHILENESVSVVVIHLEPEFSGHVEPELVRLVQRHYPARQRVGQFVVHWKPGASTRKAE